MKKNQNSKSKICKLKINDAFELENGVLDVDGLMKVEGGVDNDEDWCAIQECISSSSGSNCYTNS